MRTVVEEYAVPTAVGRSNAQDTFKNLAVGNNEAITAYNHRFRDAVLEMRLDFFF